MANFKFWIITLSCVALVPLTLGILFTALANQASVDGRSEISDPLEENDVVLPLPRVTIIPVEVGRYRAMLSSTGIVTPRYRQKIATEVSGRIIQVNPEFENGIAVKKGEVLFRIEDTALQYNLAAARRGLAEARTILAQEKQKAMRAVNDWERSGLKHNTASELLFRKPQLRAAQSAVEAAELEVRSSQIQLKKTSIKAPFDAVITSRNISPGELVQSGAIVGEIYSTKDMEVKFSVGSQEWPLLPNVYQSVFSKPVNFRTSVDIEDPATNEHWEGVLDRMTAEIDPSTKEKSLITRLIETKLNEKQSTLLPGTFVQVRFQGKVLDRLLKIPASSLTAEGDIWFVDQLDQLQRMYGKIAFSSDGTLFLYTLSSGGTEWRVVANPLSTYLPGMKVSVRVQNEITDK